MDWPAWCVLGSICTPNANAMPYICLGHQVHVTLNEETCFEITCTLLCNAVDTVIYYVYRSPFILEPQLHVQLELDHRRDAELSWREICRSSR